MAAGFLDLVRADLSSVDQKVEKAFKIKPGHLSKFAHLETESLQKYLHPALVLLSGRLFNYSGEKLVHLAAAVQFIYLASAIHFRIPDEPDEGRNSGDPRDEAQLPVLVGDYLYGRYFTSLCDGQILEFLSPLADIISDMNYGALLRKKNAGRPMEDMGIAMTVIEKETARLMEGACRMAGILAGASATQLSALAGFGLNLGMGYGILERNLDPSLAGTCLHKAGQALESLPDGAAREALAEMTRKIKNGDMAVPPKKIGRSRVPAAGEDGAPVLREQYQDKEEYVHSIFSAIAEKYDALNTVLSFNQDKYWRRFAVEQAGLKRGGSALDVCCGTGLLTLELAQKAGPSGRVVGLDFCEDMLDMARKRLGHTPYADSVEYMQGNALDLPFPDNTFDCVTVGFGLRNVPDIKKAIREMIRVVRPGGRVVCLEFSKPSVPVFKQIYNFYFDKCVPFLGRLGIGSDGPYRYLQRSWKAFPHQKELCDEFSRLGLQEATYYELTGGVVSVHVGVKPVTETPVSSVAATKE